ncbi:uncharacterized protein LOC127762839 isoform X1 [Oryza glaberrima]|uniref:uncharacterized protein LOC127762839 isoform X1 n=1 Tax=Oryza glaberrima TaxID=4538 RepID=UPI00224C42EB|nr:uncharacterized protein LOC127762839 isoform X1 [Oryza glaberrima]
MAGCSLATLRGQHRGRWIQSHSKLPTRIMSINLPKSNHSHKIQLPCQSNLGRKQKTGAFAPLGFHGRCCWIETSVKCYFLQSLVDSESMISPNLLLLSDEALLTISIVFAYLAGVVPSGHAFPHARNHSQNQHLGAPGPSDSGRDMKWLPEGNTRFYPSDTWSEVRMKLSEALQSNGRDATSYGSDSELKNNRKNYPLSMLAIHGGPRLRLLLATFQLLEMEVRNVPESSELVDGIKWLQISTTLIDGLIEPTFMKWIQEEKAWENSKINEELMKTVTSKIKEDDRILKRFNRLGKSELYLDLLYFLRFGSARSYSYFDAKFLAEHGARILEDLVIFLADAVASIYIELISVDGDMPTDVVGSSLALCSLSTRELQRMRNEVAINGWLHQYFESVVSMYEDRFELYVLSRKLCEKPADNQAEVTNWWRLGFGKPSTITLLEYVHISSFSLPVRRTKELRALAGWRYYFSLLLEMSDIAMPFIRAVVTKVSAAVSYFWVSMIGRSLGLIFSGIRQSLGWR